MAEAAVPASTTPAQTPAAGFKPEITYDDFAKLDLRVATVKSAEFHPNADRLLKVQLDDGSPTGRQVCAGIRQWYDPAAMIGRQVVIVANLAPRTIRGEISQGMILCATDAPFGTVIAKGDDSRNVVTLAIEKPVAPGSTVS